MQFSYTGISSFLCSIMGVEAMPSQNVSKKDDQSQKMERS